MSDPADSAPRPSLRDIARALNMSHVAVSLALRDSPRVSAARRAEVKAMAETLGYRPDPMLASLVAYRQGKRSTGIRACLAWINQWENPEDLRAHREFELYWQGAAEAAERLGYRLEEFRWPHGKSGRRLQTILQTRDVQGLLIPPHPEGIAMADFDWNQFSLVRFGASVHTLQAHTVTSDQAHCARLAYENAHALGYRRVGFVSEARFERNTRGHFREGYLNAQDDLAPRDVRLDTLVFATEPRHHPGELLAWLQKNRPDAIITTLPAMRALVSGLGLRVPEDVAVATTSVLDGNFDAGSDQNSHEIGRVAVSTLASLVLENERGVPRHKRRILVEGRWVNGSSMPKR